MAKPAMSAAEVREKLVGQPIGDTGEKITSAESLNFEGYFIERPATNVERIDFSFWLQQGQRVYIWHLDGCTGEVTSQGSQG